MATKSRQTAVIYTIFPKFLLTIPTTHNHERSVNLDMKYILGVRRITHGCNYSKNDPGT